MNRFEQNILAIGTLFAWIFLVLLAFEIHNVRLEVIGPGNFLVATDKSHPAKQDAANLICKEGEDCGERLSDLMSFIPRKGGGIVFAGGEVQIESTITIPTGGLLFIGEDSILSLESPQTVRAEWFMGVDYWWEDLRE